MSPPQRPDFVPLPPLPLTLVSVGVLVFSLSFSLLIVLLVMQGAGLGAVSDLVDKLAQPEGRDATIDLGIEATGALFETMMLAFTITIAQQRETQWPPTAIAWHDWIKDRSFLPFLCFMLVWQLVEDRLIEPGFPELADLERLPIGTPALLLSLVATTVLAPISEEILFRGFIFTNLRAYAGLGTTLLATSGLFALVHYSDSFVLPALTLPFGLIVGLVRERFGSVRPCIYLHVIWNLVAWGESYFGPQ